MTKFMNSEQALLISEKNKKRRVEYYLDNIENDKKVKKIKRDIEKAILNGEKECRTIFWHEPNREKRTAILEYFTGLGYEISCARGIYYVGFVQRHPTPPFLIKSSNQEKIVP